MHCDWFVELLFRDCYVTDGSFGWVAKGTALEVFSLHDAQRLAAWHFEEGSCVINDITEFGKDRTARKLVIGTSSGLICLFDVNVSVVVKVVRLSFSASENINAN